jgi:hypothetical protein
MVGPRLFLPESWTGDAERMARARVPLERQKALTKPEIAIEDRSHRCLWCAVRLRARRCGIWIERPFRQALSERGLLWAVGLSRRQNVYPADIGLDSPVTKTGRRRQYHMPDRPPVSAEAMLSEEKWRKISWRRGTKGRLNCLFAAHRVRIAEGHKHRMLDNRVQCMPGDEVWLVGERRSTGEQKYYVSNLPADTTLKMLAAAIKARWICEQAHQQFKEELGLDHFEGRSWAGLHRHALMTMIAYAFLQSRRLKAAGRKKESGDRHRNPACQRLDRPSSTSSHARLPRDVHTASDCSPSPSNLKCQSSAKGEGRRAVSAPAHRNCPPS